MDPKIFLKAPLAPIYTYFKRGARAKKKRIFFSSKFSKKYLKTPFFGLFFKILPAAQKILPKQGLFSILGELGKSIRSTYLKKKVDKIFENF